MTGKTPLIFLPGMMCDARLFAPQVKAISPERDVQVGDIAGFDTMADLAASILAHAPARFALAGLSMGGIVAMEVLRQAAQRVAGIALLDTNPLAELDEVKARREPQISRVKAGGLAAVMESEMIPNYLAGGKTTGVIADLCRAMALDLGSDIFCRQSIALRERPDQTATLRAYDKPALILCGREDRLCPVERHELMHGLMPASRLVIVEGAGHLPTLEQANQVTAALKTWLWEIDEKIDGEVDHGQ